ncbi:hypothetical protein J4Q44_G00168320 [Coregonus suidteri]|uniref:Uncharacterized protein n=1 Tax=Coregonus suidteri TaxID=861788 RepID=A0AAN8LKN6_9TELE
MRLSEVGDGTGLESCQCMGSWEVTMQSMPHLVNVSAWLTSYPPSPLPSISSSYLTTTSLHTVLMFSLPALVSLALDLTIREMLLALPQIYTH